MDIKICITFIIVFNCIVYGRILVKRENCKPLWHNRCAKNDDCCSKNCERKDPKWNYGVCGPSKQDLGNPNECKPLWFAFCKQHSNCCSKNCKIEKEWLYGYCTESKSEPVTTPKPKDEDYPEEIDEEINGETCGRRKRQTFERRIVGGKSAVRSEIPWQVGIEFKEIIRGGGSVINDHWILTAAHVFNGYQDLQDYRGIVGSISIDEAPIYVFFDKLKIHPGYKNKSGDHNNDIALLHTTKKMTLFPDFDHINSVCLPQPNSEFKDIVTVSGWGNIDSEGTDADKLMAVELHIKSDDKCEKGFKNSYNKTIMICAGHSEGGKDSCVGDSGGPMVHFNEKDVATLVGVVSYGPFQSCGEKGSAAVYTKVSKYIDWIKKSMN